MNKSILKYRLISVDYYRNCYADMSVSTEVLKFDFQDGKPTIWVSSPKNDAQIVRWNFHMYPTGQELKEKEEVFYLGTAFIDDTVWHLFEDGFEMIGTRSV